MAVRIIPSGDTSIVIEFGDRIDRALSGRVLRINGAIQRGALKGVTETVPTFRSLLIHYDPLETSAAELIERLESMTDTGDEHSIAPRTWCIPACYEDDKAPDLAAVAERTGLTPDQVIEAHCSPAYHVYMLGFLPGFPYMGDLPAELHLPRLENPRLRVPPGAVAIVTGLTAIYPIESPGGWHLIGSTPVSLFDSRDSKPARLAPGDQVHFTPITRQAFAEIEAAVATGTYSLTPQGAGA
jgi:KipI family sensor histidine kinase inhibitor